MDGALLAAGIMQLPTNIPVLYRQGIQLAFWATIHAIILVPFSSRVQAIHLLKGGDSAAYCSVISPFRVAAVAVLPWTNLRLLIKLGLPPVTALLTPILSWLESPTPQLVSEPGTFVFDYRIYFGSRTRREPSPFLSAVFSTLLIICAWALFYISITYLAIASTIFLQPPSHLFTPVIPREGHHDHWRCGTECWQWHAYPVLATGATPIVLFMSYVVVKITLWYRWKI